MLRRFSFMLVCLAAACGPIVPATTPPQLAFTPGPPIVITDRVYETGDFSVRYPADWRVVTGAADQPTNVIFVAPDEISTITVQTGMLEEATFDGDLMAEVQTITLDNGTPVTVIGRAPAETWEAFRANFDAVTASVTGPNIDSETQP